MALAFVLLHDHARCNLLGALAVAPGSLGRFFDVFVLSLFFVTDPAHMFFAWHKLLPLKRMLAASDARSQTTHRSRELGSTIRGNQSCLAAWLGRTSKSHTSRAGFVISAISR